MKLVLYLLIPTLTIAQNLKIENLSEPEARNLADQVISLSVNKWEFVSAKETKSGEYFNIKYIDSSQPKEVKDGVKNGDSCDDCLKVSFKIDSKSRKLKFNEVWGDYQDLFPAWQKYFRPDADQQKTENDLDSQELIDKPAGVNVKFKKDQESWHITNWS